MSAQDTATVGGKTVGFQYVVIIGQLMNATHTINQRPFARREYCLVGCRGKLNICACPVGTVALSGPIQCRQPPTASPALRSLRAYTYAAYSLATGYCSLASLGRLGVGMRTAEILVGLGLRTP